MALAKALAFLHRCHHILGAVPRDPIAFEGVQANARRRSDTVGNAAS